jgi:two-component system LytT family response regulator
MIKAVIVDDELKGRETLRTLIQKHCTGIEVLGMAESVASGVLLIRSVTPDLVFLDIEMPGGNGFDLLDKLKDKNFEIIFTTAYSQYAIKAIRFSALDYLLKPINPEELKDAVSRVSQLLAARTSNRRNVDTLLSNLKESNEPKKLALPNTEGLAFVNLDEIIRCQADANYTGIFLTSGKKILVARTLKDYEELLSEDNFCRVHHAHLINLKHVREYIKGEGGVVLMSDGSRVEVSRRKKNEFIERLKSI